MKVRGPRQGKEILLVLSEDTLRPSCLRGIATSSVKMPPPGTSSLLMRHRQGVPAHVPAMGEVKWNRLLCTAGPGRNVCDPHQTEPSQHQELK